MVGHRRSVRNIDVKLELNKPVVDIRHRPGAHYIYNFIRLKGSKQINTITIQYNSIQINTLHIHYIQISNSNKPIRRLRPSLALMAACSWAHPVPPRRPCVPLPQQTAREYTSRQTCTCSALMTTSLTDDYDRRQLTLTLSKVFCKNFPNDWEILNRILHAHEVFVHTLFSIILFNYL